MEVLKQLLGRLHPIIVHLPVGFIILGLLLQWYDRQKNELNNVVSLIFLWGGLCAVLACLTGYLQYLGEGFAFETVKFHLWSGILTTIFCFGMFVRLKEPKQFNFLLSIPKLALSILIFILISLTGHLGGSITHGEDYLVEPLPNNIKTALGFETFEEKKIALDEQNWQDAKLYDDVIKPILNNKCLSCHNPKRRKGELLLHTEKDILKGGENGEVIIAKNALQSELFRRINLPKTDEDHMPPKDKSQPTKEEISLIGAWIDAGPDFEMSIKEVGLAKALFLPFFPPKVENDFPNIEVAAAPKDSIQALKKMGVHVANISQETNFLKVSCINKPTFSDEDFAHLRSLKNQIAVLDLGATQVTDAIFEELEQLPYLTVLKLDHTSVTGQHMDRLSSLKHLKSINLTGTKIEAPLLSVLSNFIKLEKVFVYGTGIKSDDPKGIDTGKVVIDYGNYEVPTIPTDSIIY